MSSSPLNDLSDEEQKELVKLAKAKAEGKITRRDMMKDGRAAEDKKGRKWTIDDLLGIGLSRREALVALSAIASGALFSEAIREAIAPADAAASTSDGDGDIGSPSNRVDVYGDGVDASSVSTKKLGNRQIDVSKYSGATLAQKIENAAADNSRGVYYAPQDNDGTVWGWDKAIDIDLTDSTLIGTDVIYTLTSGNGPLLRFSGNRATVIGFDFRPESSQTPDAGVEMYDNSQMTIEKSYVNGTAKGIGSDGSGSPFRSEIRDCRVNDTTGDAFYLPAGISTSGCVNCYAAGGIGGKGFYFEGNMGLYLRGCTADDTKGYPVQVKLVQSYELENISVEASHDTGYLMDIAGESTGSIQGVRLSASAAATKPDGLLFRGGRHTLNGDNIFDTSGTDIKLVDTGSGGSWGEDYPVIDMNVDPSLSIDDNAGRSIINKYVIESASADSPQNTPYPPGTVIDFTDNGDGSGTSRYVADKTGTPQLPPS